MSLRVVFAGTPEFAIPSLNAVASHYDLCAIYTKPDSPVGRGLKLTASPIKQLALQLYPDCPIVTPQNFKDEPALQQLADFNADIMVVVAYGIILPQKVLSLFKYGCINVHASLLPFWRGAAPIARALLAGDSHTGVTIMQLDAGLDTGCILQQAPYAIQPEDTSGTVHDQLAQLGADILISTIEDMITGRTTPIAQDNRYATYAAKICKDEAAIVWQHSAKQITLQTRAFNPWPVAYTYLHGKLLKIWQTTLINETATQHPPGTVIAVSDNGIDVATGEGVVQLQVVQSPGGKAIAVKDFLNNKNNQIVPFVTILGQCNASHP